MEQFPDGSLKEIREKLKQNIQKLPHYAGKDIDGILDKLVMAVVQNPLQYIGFGINKLTKLLENSEAVEAMDLVIVSILTLQIHKFLVMLTKEGNSFVFCRLECKIKFIF